MPIETHEDWDCSRGSSGRALISMIIKELVRSDKYSLHNLTLYMAELTYRRPDFVESKILEDNDKSLLGVYYDPMTDSMKAYTNEKFFHRLDILNYEDVYRSVRRLI